MADKLAAREPGEDGSMQGQIKTPMCAENVQNKGGEGKVEKFKGTMNLNAAGPSKGAMKTDNAIEGPGIKGNWTGGTKISGSNKRY